MSGLNPRWIIGDLDLTDYPFAVVFGSDYGTPDASPAVLASFLTDGDLELTARRGNRTLTLPVLVEGADMVALAEAERALQLECDKPLNTLYVDPGDGYGEPFQWTVFRGTATFQRDDKFEDSGYRLWQLTWRALPWPEAATEVTVPSLATTGSTTTNVDDMSSATGWAGSVSGLATTPTSAGGALTVQRSLGPGKYPWSATRSGSITTSATPYLVLDWKPTSASLVTAGVKAVGDGVTLPIIASQPSPTAGYTRTWFQVAAASVSTLIFTANIQSAAVTGTTSLGIVMDNLDRTDARPTAGSVKQQLRSIEIAGSAPTSGSVAIEHASSPLGDVLFYSCPDDGSGYVPAMRGYHTSGTVTSDATAVSGSYDTLSSSPATASWSAPYLSVPEGEYAVLARMSGATAGAVALNWVFSTQVAGTNVGTVPTVAYSGTLTTSYALYRVSNLIHLPPFDATVGPNSTVKLLVTWQSGVTVHLDEVWLFNVSTGRLSQFYCGTGSAAAGGPANRVWIDAPTVENDGLGRYLMGTAADRSDAYGAVAPLGVGLPADNLAAASLGVHEFEPGANKVFVVTSNPTTAVDVSYRYRPAGHSSVYSG